MGLLPSIRARESVAAQSSAITSTTHVLMAVLCAVSCQARCCFHPLSSQDPTCIGTHTLRCQPPGFDNFVLSTCNPRQVQPMWCHLAEATVPLSRRRVQTASPAPHPWVSLSSAKQSCGRRRRRLPANLLQLQVRCDLSQANPETSTPSSKRSSRLL